MSSNGVVIASDRPTPIVDGFTMNSRLMNPYSYFNMALAQMEPLRRANGYRARWYAVPDVLDLPIPAFESVEYQIRCQPGSYLWGLCFFAQPPGSSPSSLSNNSVRIVDSCTELPILDRPALSEVFTASFVNPAVQQENLGQNRPPVLLPQPYLVSAPGTMNVEITNGSSFTSNCQLLMMFAEPSINEVDYQNLIKRLR